MKHLFVAIVLCLFAVPCRAEEDPCARIISLAPSITEVIFELGLGNKLVGVTRYCRYPPEAQSITKVGGFYDMSLEGIIALKPTYVFGLRENAEIRQSATRFGIPSRELDHTTIEGIKASISTIAAICRVEQRAGTKLAELADREQAVRKLMTGSQPYKALVIVGRMHEGNDLSGVYVSGTDGFYSGVLKLLGMTNVNSDPTVAVPMLSPEGLMTLAPDVIVEIVNVDDPQLNEGEFQLWKRYPNLPAVKHKRVFALTQDYASIPGPRYILVAEDLARRLKGETPS